MTDIIPSNRLPISGFWRDYAGIPGGIPITTGWTVTPITGLDTTGGASISDTVNTYINAASPRTILTIGTGTFLVTGRISIAKNHILLRGAKDASYINLNNYANIDTGNCTVFRISGVNAGVYVGVSSSFRAPASITGCINTSQTSGVLAGAGTTGLIVNAASVTGLVLNKMARIYQQNNSGVPIVAVGGYNNIQGQYVIIRSTGQYTVGFEPPLGFNLYSGLTPEIECNVNMFSGSAIENIFFDGTRQTGSSYHVNFNYLYKGWITGCQFFNAIQYMHYWNGALQCEARHNTTWLNRGGDGTYTHGPNMAGHKLDSCCSCLVTDSIFYRQFPSIQINGSSAFTHIGSHGNVVAYNFSTQAYNANDDAAQDYESSHGPHCQYDLYEGNIGDKFSMDAYYGSAAYVTALRNWYGGANPYSSTNNIAVNINRFARYYNIIGNILGKPGVTGVHYINTSGVVSSSVYRIYRMNYPNTDNSNFNGSVQPSSGTYWADWGTAAGPNGFQELDLDVEATTLYKGNYIVPSGQITANESLNGSGIVNSYLYDSTPSWWPNSLTWPPFDSSSPNPATGANPAGYRYLYGTDPAFVLYAYKRLGRHIKLKGLSLR